MPIGGFGGNKPNTASSMQAAADAARAESAARRVEQGSRDANDRLERLTLVCMAMWSLLQDKTNLTEADLLERVKLIDNIDGTPDGKATRGVRSCPKCHRTMSPRHRKCLYCGTEETHSSAFDAV
ncbi:MAG: hypothetical protein AAGI54_08335 [Planctomycetota bacterium]